MSFTYKDAVQKLNSLQTNASILEQLRKAGPRMNERSLPEMKHYLKRIGYEPKDFDRLNIIHVTGTKGKGSTCALTESILRHSSSDKKTAIRTGLFTSPHLVAVRERIRINGEPLSEEKFAEYSQYVWEQLEKTKDQKMENAQEQDQDTKAAIKKAREHPDKPTYFRYMTLLAFRAFMEEKVDVAILEVGVGGEYDSTNVIETPVVCGITALGLDHVSVLGNTLDQIAWHKAGIFKHRVPAISFDQPPEAMEVVKKRAQDKDAPLQVIPASLVSALDNVDVGLAGLHQRYNALTAMALCKVWLAKQRDIHHDVDPRHVPDAFKEGLQKVKWPGRGQQLEIGNTAYANKARNVTWYLDGAHTVESLQVCADWFRESAGTSGSPGTRVLVFNCTNGRDGPHLLNVVANLQKQLPFDHVVFTTNMTYRKGYTSDNTNNTVSMEDALAMQKALAGSWTEQVHPFPSDSVHIVGTIEDAVDWVVDYRSRVPEHKAVQVLTTGSLILVGNTLTVLGIPPQ